MVINANFDAIDTFALVVTSSIWFWILVEINFTFIYYCIWAYFTRIKNILICYTYVIDKVFIFFLIINCLNLAWHLICLYVYKYMLIIFSNSFELNMKRTEREVCIPNICSILCLKINSKFHINSVYNFSMVFTLCSPWHISRTQVETFRIMKMFKSLWRIK